VRAKYVVHSLGSRGVDDQRSIRMYERHRAERQGHDRHVVHVPPRRDVDVAEGNVMIMTIKPGNMIYWNIQPKLLYLVIAITKTDVPTIDQCLIMDHKGYVFDWHVSLADVKFNVVHVIKL
jgi:hypothetical protein